MIYEDLHVHLRVVHGYVFLIVITAFPGDGRFHTSGERNAAQLDGENGDNQRVGRLHHTMYISHLLCHVRGEYVCSARAPRGARHTAASRVASLDKSAGAVYLFRDTARDVSV